MSVRDREARRLRTLAARLDQDWRIVEAVHARVQEAVAYHLDRSSSDTVSIGAVALYLQNFYTAVEDLLKRIATELNGWAAGGEDWHRELLEQMSLDVEGIRPALVDELLRSDLDHLRRFRHRVRHAYAEEYDWDEMQNVLEAQRRCMDQFPKALSRLQGFLREAIEALEGGP